MSYRSDNKFVIYPLYFDKMVSRNIGRRLPKKQCLEKPTITELSKAAKAAGLSPSLEKGKSHPARPWKKEGRILVDKKGSKQEILHQLTRFL
ncbi:MAG: signal recognition particle protein Srp19 [Candidatus Thermoplasmatota archaeon]|nr:signal recognition particle protein Srp19 [Candidatus Thermoplasmatota archaeon]MBS3801586.1 signal recognition particle protein Srp19 [Candidatus Thermoplasmatota archaeon]